MNKIAYHKDLRKQSFIYPFLKLVIAIKDIPQEPKCIYSFKKGLSINDISFSAETPYITKLLQMVNKTILKYPDDMQ